MWFFKTGNGTFCIRYFREGYGLFIDQDYISWFKDAETAAKTVLECRTGHKPWDSRGVADSPKDLSEWQTLEEFQAGGAVKPTHDPVVVPLDCSCGHQIRESVARIRTVGKFRCPDCNGEIRVGADQLREIFASVSKQYPNGYIKGLSQK